MDELKQLFDQFVNLDDVHDHAYFMRTFSNIMKGLIILILEVLIDCANVQDRVHLYNSIFIDLVNLVSHLNELEQYIATLE